MIATRESSLIRLGAMVVAGLVLASTPAVADRSFSNECKNRDSSTPPDGTQCIGGGNNTGPGQTIAFPGTMNWTVPDQPPQQPETDTFLASVLTPANFLCGPQVCSGYLEFYTRDADQQTCGASCSFTTNHWARYGSASGFVTLKNGMPLSNFFVSALDPTRTQALDWSKGVLTNEQGFYTFSKDKAPVYSFEAPGLLGPLITIPPSNNWGLRVEQQESETQPQKTYFVTARDQQVQTVVRSSEMASVSFQFTWDELKNNPPNKNCDISESEEDSAACEGESGCSDPSAPPTGPSCLQDTSLALACLGAPVSVISGNVSLTQTDAVLSGTVPLVLRRTYNSADATTGLPGVFGPGWTSTFDRSIAPLQYSGTLAVRKSSGALAYFTDNSGTGHFQPYNAYNGRSSIVQVGGGYERTLLSGRKETYDQNGRLASLVDPAGNVITLEYDVNTRQLVSATAPGGRQLRFSYVGSRFQLAAVSGPEGTIATYGYDASGRLIRTAYADGSGYEYAYDNQNRLLQMRDLGGVVIESHTYSTDGKGLTSERADGVERLTFSYAPGRTTVTDALGNVTQYDLENVDEIAVLKKITGPCSSCGASGDTQEWTHDGQGRTTAFKDGLGQTWSYAYDADGNRTSVTDPLNRTTTYGFDGRGRVLGVSPPGGGGRTYTYADAGLLSVTDALGHASSMAYTATGDIRSVTTARGKTYTLSRNAHGDLTSMRDPLNRVTTYDIDASGRVGAVTDPAGRTVRVQRDARGRIAGVQLATGDVWTIFYDKGGRETAATDPVGRTTQYGYDRYGRMVSVLDPLNGLVTLAFDRMSNITALTDQEHRTTQFEYDAHGRHTKTTYPDGRFEQYGYDSAGQLSTLTNRLGIVTTYHRDPLGRVTSMTYSDGTPSVTYGYDGRGRMESAGNDADTLTWTYDDADEVVSETSTANSSQLSYSWDADGLQSTLGLDGPNLVTYEWDDLARLTSLTRSGRRFEFAYDDASRRASLAYPNGIMTTYAYDAGSRLTQLSTTASVPFNAHYTYDRVGNRTNATVQGQFEVYGYDRLNRLTSVERGTVPPTHWHFAYDAVGNRVTSQYNDAVLTASFDSANRLVSTTGGGSLVIQGTTSEPARVTVNGVPATVGPNNTFEATVQAGAGANEFTVAARDLSGNEQSNTYRVQIPASAGTYTYDTEGRLIERSDGGVTWTYEWNVVSQLTRVSRDGVEVVRFSYDPLGRRITKTAGGVTYRYVYDGPSILRASRSDSPEAVLYVQSLAIDEPLAREDASGSLVYYHTDGLGSITNITDAGGNVVKGYEYDPWGNVTATGSLNTEEAEFAYTGREWDAQTGLYYYRARYYDPKLGTFVSEDPIGLVGGMNFYRYALDNPSRFKDPSGKDVWIEGPSGNEPAGHQSINVGDPYGAYDSYSFGVNGDPWLGGAVYRDVSQGGEIDYSHYLYTTAYEDAWVKSELEGQLDSKAPYRPWRTCRNYSQDEFARIKAELKPWDKDAVFIGPPRAPRPKAPGKGTMVPSPTSTSAWDWQNAKNIFSSGTSK